jgi:hypothetical protein
MWNIIVAKYGHFVLFDHLNTPIVTNAVLQMLEEPEGLREK